MRRKCLADRGILQVRNVEFPAGGFDDSFDSRVMNVADLRKQVMFHLEIQSAQKPCNDLAPGGEVCRCCHLVDEEFSINLIRVWLGFGEVRDLIHMGQLKHNGYENTCCCRGQ